MLTPVSSMFGVPHGSYEPVPAFVGKSVDLSAVAVQNAREVRAPHDVLQAFEKALNDLLPDTLPPQTRLIIEVDPDTNHFVYKSVDASSGKLVKQWPSEKILDMIKTMRELSGIAVDGKAWIGRCCFSWLDI